MSGSESDAPLTGYDRLGICDRTVESLITVETRWNRIQSICRKNMLLLLTIVGVFLGLGVGVAVHAAEPSQTAVTLVYFPGEIFLRMLKMMIVPLIVASLVSGVASLDVQASGRLGRRAIIYYMSTTFSAVVLGIILVNIIRPGSGADCEKQHTADETVDDPSTLDTFLDLIRNMFPENLVVATFQTVRAVSAKRIWNCTMTGNSSNSSCSYVDVPLPRPKNGRVEAPPPLEMHDGMNVLGLIVFSIAFGLTLAGMGKKGKPLVRVFDSLNEAIMRMVNVIMLYSPVGIMFLIMGKMASVGDFSDLISSLGLYFLTVIVGLSVHALIILPAIFFAFCRRNPFRYASGVAQALATAFGTSSSSATLPVTMRCLEEKVGIDQRVTRFMLPIGATINMDGTALYEAVATIFIAQYTCKSLNFGHMLAVSVTATAASIGAAGIPSAGLFTMVIVLSAVGLSPEYAYLIFPVDWLLDRFRTSVNVLGDSFGAGIVEHLSRNDLCKNKLDSERTGESHTTYDSITSSTSSSESQQQANRLAAPSSAQQNGFIESSFHGGDSPLLRKAQQ